MFKGEHISSSFKVLIHIIQAYSSPTFFDSTKWGERKQVCEDLIQVQNKASPNYKAKIKSQATSKARFVFAKFCNFICFRFLFVIIKKGEIVEATLSRSPYVLMITNKPSKHIK